MAEIQDLSTTDASNTDASYGFPENMNPSAVNDNLRAILGMIARWYADTNGSIATTGSSNAYVLAASRTISSYTQGQTFTFEANHANTGAATLNVDSVGAKAIVKRNDVALASGDIEAGQIVMVAYEATADNFQMLTPTAASSDVITTRGDIIRGDSSGVAERLAVGSANTHLNSDGTDASWVAGPLGKQTIFVPASAMRPTSSNGCASLTDVETTSGRPDMQVLDFDASSDEHAQFQVAFPKGWDEGTVTFRAYWTVSSAVSTGVAIGLQGVACGDSDTIDVAYGTAIVVTDDALNAAEDLSVTSESSAVTIAGSPAADEMTFFRVFRDVSDANDDMTQDMRLIGIQLFFTLDAGNDA
jgi:hypothetical protein